MSYRIKNSDFFSWSGPKSKGINVGSTKIDLPINYFRDDCFIGFFSAAYKPVKKLLPSNQLYPVRLLNGKAVVAVAAFNYIETSIGHYGEVGIVVPCIHGKKPLPLIPLLLEALHPGWNVFVLHLPVTSIEARDAGKVIWGYPKFVADMDFEKHPEYQSVRLEEGGQHILTLKVKQKGLPIKDSRYLITSSFKNNELVKTIMPIQAVYQAGVGSAMLILGDHQISEQLRRLGISKTAFIGKNYLSKYVVLPSGDSMEKSEKYYQGYDGQDVPIGRFTIKYEHSQEPIDLYKKRDESHDCQT